MRATPASLLALADRSGRIAAAGLVAVPALLAAPARAQAIEPTLVGSDTAGGDRFGQSVSLSGDLLVVGADQHDAVASLAGAAYVFRREGGSWVQLAKLAPASLAAGDRFGFSVATDGTTIVVGSPSDDEVESASGAIWIYELAGDSVVSLGKVKHPSPNPLNWFGSAVAVEGDTLVVAARDSSTGDVYVFERSGGTWQFDEELLAPDLSFGDDFGTSVAISGNWILGGAPRVDDAGGNAGAVYAFERDGASWAYRQQLQPQGLAADDRLGYSVAIDGDTAVVSSVEADAAGTDSGAAHVYTLAGGSWNEGPQLLPHDGQTSALFGYSVDVDGDRILVGSQRFANDFGRAYLFLREGGAWGLASAFDPYGVFGVERFGHAVALDGDRAALSSWGDNTGGPNSGAVYPFDLSPTLLGGRDDLRIAIGGTQPHGIAPGPAFAGNLYFVLGSLSGTGGGLPVGGGFFLPLAPDPYLDFTLANPNSVALPSSLGLVPAGGEVTAEFVLPAGLDPSFANLTVHHAFVVLDPVGANVLWASEALAVDLKP